MDARRMPTRRPRARASSRRWSGGFGPRRMKSVLAAMKVRGMSDLFERSAHPSGHPMPHSVDEIGAAASRRHRGRQPARGRVRRERRSGVERMPDPGRGGRGGRAGSRGAGVGRRRLARGRVLDGGRRIRVGALAARDVRVPDRRRARRAGEVPARGGRASCRSSTRRGASGKDDADRMSTRIVANPGYALDTLAREELGLDPGALGSPVGAAVFSFAAFAVGAAIPLAPFVVRGGRRGAGQCDRAGGGRAVRRRLRDQPVLGARRAARRAAVAADRRRRRRRHLRHRPAARRARCPDRSPAAAEARVDAETRAADRSPGSRTSARRPGTGWCRCSCGDRCTSRRRRRRTRRWNHRAVVEVDAAGHCAAVR